MGKISKAMSFKNSEIDVENMILHEIGKDYSEEFSLLDILKQWDGIPGISLSIKQECNYSTEESDESGDEQ